jgi:hypothetical protein
MKVSKRRYNCKTDGKERSRKEVTFVFKMQTGYNLHPVIGSEK